MPAAIGAAIAAVIAEITMAKIVSFIALTAISSILQNQQARRQREAALEAKIATLKDAQVTVRVATEPRKVPYGRVRLGGLVPFVQSSGDDKRFMHVVIVLAGCQIDAVEKVYFNEFDVTPDIDGVISGTQFRQRKPAQRTWNGTAGLSTSASPGEVLLPETPLSIDSVTQAVTADNGEVTYELLTGWGLSGSIITGLPPGMPVAINYQINTGIARAKIRYHLGAPDQAADPDLMAACPDEWAANHRLRGCAYLYIAFEFDSDVYQSGLPNVTAVIRGKRCYDPRDGVTRWTQNPALIARDWRTERLGMDLPASSIDDDWVIAAANRCDELVEVAAGEFQPRYACDCVLEASREIADDYMDAIVETMAGGQCNSAGLWRVWAGGFRAPEMRLGVDDVRAVHEYAAVPSADNLFNTVKGTFVDAERGYQSASFAEVSEAQYVAADGAKITAEQPWKFTTDKHRALRLSKIRIRAARGGTLSCTTGLAAWRLLPGEMVYINLPYLNLINALMIVDSMSRDNTAQIVKLQLRHLPASVWNWDYRQQEVIDREVEARIPDVSQVAPPASVVVQSGPDFAVVAADGSVVNRLRVTWSAPVDQLAISTELEWKDAGEDQFRARADVLAGQTSWFLGPVRAGQHYIVRLRHRNVAGRVSAWEVLGHTASDAQGAPASVLNLSSDSGSNIAPGSVMRVRWQRPLLADRYVVEVRADSAVRRTRTVYGEEFAYSWEDAKADGGPWRSITIEVQAANASAVSAAKASLTLQNLAPAQPTVQIIEGIQSLVVRTGRPGDTDFAGMLVWGSATSGFTPGPANLLYDGPDVNFVLADVSAQMYFRVAHYDSFGKSDTGAGLNLSVQASGIPSPAGGIRVYTTGSAPSISDPDHPEVWYNSTLGTMMMEIGGVYVDVRDGQMLYNGTVAANKVYAASLSAISANLGTVTSGRYEVDAAGWIRGGQTSFANGTGFFMGFQSGKYVLSIGQSGGAQFTWDGTKLEVRGASGQLLISTDSGVQIPNASITLAKIDLATIGSLSALSANIGTITSGRLQSVDGRNYLDLDAVSAQPFLRVRDTSMVDKAIIRADGTTKFANNVASGNWTGSVVMETSTPPFDGGGAP